MKMWRYVKHLLLLMTNILQCDFPANLKIISSVAQTKVLTLPSRHLDIRIGSLKRKRRRLHLTATSAQCGLREHLPRAIFRDTDANSWAVHIRLQRTVQRYLALGILQWDYYYNPSWVAVWHPGLVLPCRNPGFGIALHPKISCDWSVHFWGWPIWSYSLLPHTLFVAWNFFLCTWLRPSIYFVQQGWRLHLHTFKSR